jgi:hypothetical protein
MLPAGSDDASSVGGRAVASAALVVVLSTVAAFVDASSLVCVVVCAAAGLAFSLDSAGPFDEVGLTTVEPDVSFAWLATLVSVVC